MEGVAKTSGQWIVMMGLLVSTGIIFLALIINQSVLVGQTTAEGVLEFPKTDIQDMRHIIIESEQNHMGQSINANLALIAMARKGAVAGYNVIGSPGSARAMAVCIDASFELVNITYNNGVMSYTDSTCIPKFGGPS